MLLTNKHIAIIGAGPGGLTLARLLQRSGASVHVYERDQHPAVRVQGATLDLHLDSGLLALQEAGLMDAFRANYRPGADRLRIVDKDAQVLHEETGDDPDALFRPEIDRGPLRNLLLDSLEPGTVLWDCQFKSMTQRHGAWTLTFANGATARADLVIAADGARSLIRPYLTPLQPFYSGVTIVEGNVPDSATTVPVIHELLAGGKIFAMGDEKSLIISSKGDGSLVFYFGCKTPANWHSNLAPALNDRQQLKNWFRQTFANWADMWLALLEQATLPLVVRPQYCMPLDQQWDAQPNLTMIGDAAHLMPPYAGEGVNMAMLDALELSQCVTNDKFADIQTAIAAFETRMRQRAAEIARLTLEQTASMHSPQAIPDLLALFSPTDS